MSEKKLNILFLSSWYPNKVQPTLGNFVQKHAESVAVKSNVAVLYICSDINCTKAIETEIANINNVYTINVYFKKSANPIIKLIRYYKALTTGLKSVKNKFPAIDLVHQNILYPVGCVALYLKKRYHIPYIITEHWTDYLPSKNYRFGALELYLSKKIAKNATLITTVTKDLENAMKNLGFTNTYRVVYNVVNTSIFTLPAVPKKTDKIKFLHISHLDDEYKNTSGMLRVVKRLAEKRSDFEFWFVGDGDTKPHEKLAKELAIYNSFAFFDGTKTTKEVAELMKESDCFVLFSNYENLPVVIIEAMACGLPIISTDVGGIAEHISTNFGTLIQPKDENGLFTSLDTMINDIKKNKYSPLESNTYANTYFSYEQVGKRFHEIYMEALTKYV